MRHIWRPTVTDTSIKTEKSQKILSYQPLLPLQQYTLHFSFPDALLCRALWFKLSVIDSLSKNKWFCHVPKAEVFMTIHVIQQIDYIICRKSETQSSQTKWYMSQVTYISHHGQKKPRIQTLEELNKWKEYTKLQE